MPTVVTSVELASLMIIGIDHILIAVEDLDKEMDLYRRLGFQVLRGEEHPKDWSSQPDMAS